MLVLLAARSATCSGWSGVLIVPLLLFCVGALARDDAYHERVIAPEGTRRHFHLLSWLSISEHI